MAKTETRLRALRNLRYPKGKSLELVMAAGGLSKLIAEMFEDATGSTVERLHELGPLEIRGDLSKPEVKELETLSAAMREVQGSIDMKHVKAGSFCDFLRKDLPSSSVDALLRSGKVETVEEKKKAKPRAKKKDGK